MAGGEGEGSGPEDEGGGGDGAVRSLAVVVGGSGIAATDCPKRASPSPMAAIVLVSVADTWSDAACEVVVTVAETVMEPDEMESPMVLASTARVDAMEAM